MSKRMFAVKVPEREKKAMDLAAVGSGETLAGLFYPGILQDTRRYAGALAVNALYAQRHSTKKQRIKLPLPGPGEHFVHTIPMIKDFLDLIAVKKKELNAILPGVSLTDKGFLLLESDPSGILIDLGEKYLKTDASLKVIDTDLALSLLFDVLIQKYYRITAQGSMDALQSAWKACGPELRTYMDGVKKSYRAMFRDDFIEVIEVEAIQ